MQNFSELYKSIKDPLLNDEILKKLPKFKNNHISAFSFLTQHSQNKKVRENKEKYDYRESLYLLLYDIWRTSILNLNKEELRVLKNRNSYDGKIYELFNILSQQDKTIDTYEELKELFEKYPLIEKYCWHRYEPSNSHFVHVYSRELKAKQEEYMEIKHRLYINPEPNDTYYLLGLFTVQAWKSNIHFYYKFHDVGNQNRDDTIVMYADDDNLFDYINILKNIAQNHPSIIDRCNKPPILTGYIDDWIGYATQPNQEMVEKHGSYNNMTSELLKKSLKETYEILESKKVAANPYSILRNCIAKYAKIYGLDGQKICFDERIKEKIVEESNRGDWYNIR